MINKITDIKAEQILDSRNNPTLKVSVYSDDVVGTFEVPSGASTGKYEACELRDPSVDEASGKKGINIAIEKIHSFIKPALLGMNVDNQTEIDKIMIKLDGTPQKTNLGGNSMIGVSIACAKASAKINKQEVYEYLRTLRLSSGQAENEIKPSRHEPFLYFNLINGGKHAKSKLAFQEFHIVPQTETVSESVKISREIQTKLDEIIKSEYGDVGEKGDEGGIALPIEDVLVPLQLLKKATEKLGYQDKVKFALDVAASSFYDHDRGVYFFMNQDWSRDKMIELYKKICDSFPMISIEDPLDEEDFEGFTLLQNSLPSVKIIGDDLTVTNSQRLSKAIEEKSVHGIIIKPNQIGTLTETIATIKLARENHIDCIVSHRSGETMDDFIADLAYAYGCFGIKAGALGPKERNVKYDRLISITKQ